MSNNNYIITENAIVACDEAIKQYDFALATSTCYNLWLYDLCDIYLVSNNFLIHI